MKVSVFWLRLAICCVGVGLVLSLPLGYSADEPPLPDAVVSFRGHTEAVYSVTLSPDGKLVATGSFDRSLRVWDAATGKPLRAFSGANCHKNLVLSVAFSPKGDLIASGSSDNTARIWEVPTTAPLRSATASAPPTVVAVSPNAALVANGAKDGVIELWDAANGQVKFRLVGHVGEVTGLAFTPNGQLLLSTGVDQTLRYWNPTNGQAVNVTVAHTVPIRGLAIHPNGSQAYTIAADGSVKFWQLPPTADRALPAHGNAVTALALSADGATVLSGAADKVVRLTNVGNGQVQREFPGLSASVASVALAPNNTLALAGSVDGQLALWQIGDGKLVAQLSAHAGAVHGLSFLPNATQWLSVGADGMLRHWQLPLPTPKPIPHPATIRAAVVSADGKKIFTVCADPTVRLHRLADGALERSYSGATAPLTTLSVAGNANLLAAGAEDGSVRLWKLDDGQLLGTALLHQGRIETLQFTPNADRLISSGADGRIKAWPLPWPVVKPLPQPEPLTRIVPASDGSRWLWVSAKEVRLVNAASLQVERSHSTGQPLVAATLGLDGTTIAVANADRSVVLFKDGKEWKKVPPLPAEVRSLALRPDLAVLAVGLADHSIRLIDLAPLKEMKNLTGHSGAVNALTYSTKGDWLISAGADRTLRLWAAAEGTAKEQRTLEGEAVLAVQGEVVTAAYAVPANQAVALLPIREGKFSTATVVPGVGAVKSLALAASGQAFAVVLADGSVRVYRPEADAKSFTPQEGYRPEGGPLALALSADGKRLLLQSANKELRVEALSVAWSLTSASATPPPGGTTTPATPASASSGTRRTTIELRPQMDQALLLHSTSGSVQVIVPQTGKAMREVKLHDGAIVASALSVDGNRLVTAGADPTLRLWNVADLSKPIATWTLPAAAQQIALSPNGLRLAVVYPEGTSRVLKVFDTTTGRDLQTLARLVKSIEVLTFARDNRTVVTAGEDQQVTVYDLSVLSAWSVHAEGASAVVASTNGVHAFTAGKDKQVRQWDLASGKEMRAWTLPEGGATLALSRDSNRLIAGAGKMAQVWQVSDGKELATLTHPAAVIAVGFSPDGTRAISGTTDNLARVWDLATAKELQAFSHGAAVRGVAYLPNQPVVLSASADKTMLVRPLSFVRLAAVANAELTSLLVHPNQPYLVIGSTNKKVYLVRLDNGAIERTFDGLTGPITSLAISRNGQTLAVAGDDRSVRLYTFNDGREVGSIEVPAAVRALSFSASGSILLGACADKRVYSWNVAYQPGQQLPEEFGQVVQPLEHPDTVHALAWPDNGPIVTACADRQVRWWKFASDQAIRSLAHPNLVDCVAWSADASQLATGCHDGVLRLWDVVKGQLLKNINAHTQPTAAPIYAVAWSPDGRLLATASFDRSVKVWEATSGNLVREIKPYTEKTFEQGHRDQVFCVTFTPEGKYLISGSSDRTLKVWEVATGNLVREFHNPTLKPAAMETPTAHPGWIYAVKLSQDGSRVVSVGSAPRNHGYIAVWNFADGKFLAGKELPSGTIFSATLPDRPGQVLIGCGPRYRQASTAEAVLLKLPGW